MIENHSQLLGCWNRCQKMFERISRYYQDSWNNGGHKFPIMSNCFWGYVIICCPLKCLDHPSIVVFLNLSFLSTLLPHDPFIWPGCSLHTQGLWYFLSTGYIRFLFNRSVSLSALGVAGSECLHSCIKAWHVPHTLQGRPFFYLFPLCSPLNSTGTTDYFSSENNVSQPNIQKPIMFTDIPAAPICGSLPSTFVSCTLGNFLFCAKFSRRKAYNPSYYQKDRSNASGQFTLQHQQSRHCDMCLREKNHQCYPHS